MTFAYSYEYTVKPVLKATCIKQSPILKCHISDPIKDKDMEIYLIKQASVLNNHFLLSRRCLLNTGLTVLSSHPFSIALLNRNVRKRNFVHVRPPKIQISLRPCTVWSEYSLGAVWVKIYMRTTKTLIRLRGCAVWFESLLAANVKRYVFSSCCSLVFSKMPCLEMWIVSS